MHRIGNDQGYVSIEATEDEEVARQRNDICCRGPRLGFGIVRLHDEKIFARRLQCRRRVETKPGKCATMPAKEMPVQPDRRNFAHAVELQEITASFPGSRRCEPQTIPSRTLNMVRVGRELRAGISKSVPSVRNADLGPAHIVEGRAFDA